MMHKKIKLERRMSLRVLETSNGSLQLIPTSRIDKVHWRTSHDSENLLLFAVINEIPSKVQGEYFLFTIII